MFNNYLWVESGGLLSYGVNFSDSYRRAAEQVAMILNGAKPTEMPVEQSTAVELAINRRTAKALSLRVPQTIVVRADRFVD